MIRDQEELVFRCIVDEAPRAQSMLESGRGLEGQRHGSIVSAAIDRFREGFESFHQDDVHPVGGVKSHVGKNQLPVVSMSSENQLLLGLWTQVREILRGSALDANRVFPIADVDGRKMAGFVF